MSTCVAAVRQSNSASCFLLMVQFSSTYQVCTDMWTPIYWIFLVDIYSVTLQMDNVTRFSTLFMIKKTPTSFCENICKKLVKKHLST